MRLGQVGSCFTARSKEGYKELGVGNWGEWERRGRVAGRRMRCPEASLWGRGLSRTSCPLARAEAGPEPGEAEVPTGASTSSPKSREEGWSFAVDERGAGWGVGSQPFDVINVAAFSACHPGLCARWASKRTEAAGERGRGPETEAAL